MHSYRCDNTSLFKQGYARQAFLDKCGTLLTDNVLSGAPECLAKTFRMALPSETFSPSPVSSPLFSEESDPHCALCSESSPCLLGVFPILPTLVMLSTNIFSFNFILK